MLLSLQSTRPQYNHIQTYIQIPWNCEYVKYYVESVNTKSLLITDEEDFIEIYYEFDEVDLCLRTRCNVVSLSFDASFQIKYL